MRGVPHDGFNVLKEETTDSLLTLSSLFAMWGHSKRWLRTRKSAHTRNQPCWHLILNSQPPQLWEVNFCCWNYPSYGILLWQPKPIKTERTSIPTPFTTSQFGLLPPMWSLTLADETEEPREMWYLIRWFLPCWAATHDPWRKDLGVTWRSQMALRRDSWGISAPASSTQKLLSPHSICSDSSPKGSLQCSQGWASRFSLFLDNFSLSFSHGQSCQYERGVSVEGNCNKFLISCEISPRNMTEFIWLGSGSPH